MAVMYVAMFAVFTYVDISWDARSTVFLGLCMSSCANYGSVADRPPATALSAASQDVADDFDTLDELDFLEVFTEDRLGAAR